MTGKPAAFYDKSNPDWAPTQNMRHNKSIVNVDAAALTRHGRVTERAQKRKLAQEKETLQYDTIQYNTIQYNTIQYNTIQYNNLFRVDHVGKGCPYSRAKGSS